MAPPDTAAPAAQSAAPDAPSTSTSTCTSDIRRVARDVFGWSDLQPGQAEAVASVLAGHDTLVVMPTGSGKSAIYQIATQLLPGLTVVISPLVALQEDQVASIERRLGEEDADDGDGQAVVINASRSSSAVCAAWEAVEDGSARYVFLAPEQLANEDVLDRLRAATVSLITVDEAHCVSSWGHDFRPDYLVLGEVVDQLGHPPVLALTATGSAPVRAEILERLHMTDPTVMAHGFDRPNLRLEVVRHEDDAQKREAVVAQVAEIAGAGILYVATRAETEEYATALQDRGRAAAAYHAGMRAADREAVHTSFIDGSVDVVVATTAFGMGIDKPDVRFVAHADVPESVDAYYQEIGRAGRDGEPAVATLHYRQADLGLRRFFAAGSPKPATLRAVFEGVPAGSTLRRSQLAEASGLTARTATRAANALVEADALVDDEEGLRRADGPAGASADAAAAAAAEQAAEREQVEQSRIAMMQQFAETRGCRRQFLLGYFGDELDHPCGNCDTCSAGTAYDDATTAADGAHDAEWPPESAVEHAEWGSGTVMSTEEDRITVFFPAAGYRVLALADIREHELLRRVPA
ncbi:RecQ family ATP-dependent DNA helicase [Curtobacterium ammoniigenes]|uniref:RecQ family ATP-dependent DNA helicase n=1 Tax=Curtobacterium ammoniigenes TaxID=395387 RepID=UPI0009FB84F1|nr:RecQ family ATP-dependent DNA helicase [Curtobacterium ammoniigenes]